MARWGKLINKNERRSHFLIKSIRKERCFRTKNRGKLEIHGVFADELIKKDLKKDNITYISEKAFIKWSRSLIVAA
jgi:hypothetical protein